MHTKNLFNKRNHLNFKNKHDQKISLTMVKKVYFSKKFNLNTI